MMSMPFRSLSAVLAACLLLGTGVAQDKEKSKPEKQDPAVAEKLKELDKAVNDRKMEHDVDAARIIDDLAGQYESMHEKDQKDVRSGFRKVFDAKERKPDNPGLYRATVFALGKIGGPDAAAILVKLLDNSSPFHDRDWISMQQDILENIGKTKDVKQIDFLLKTALRAAEDPVKGAAGKALRYFEDQPLGKRQEVFVKMLVDYEKIYGEAMSTDSGNEVTQTRKRTLNTIQDPWNGTLGALSGQACGTAVEWRKWYNDHKDDKKAWK
ncbi:MAG: HEAT repeat domain-containing protein [Planctomycetota bacterium]